jgi:tetratricopeptide (TPR) repeat protein
MPPFLLGVVITAGLATLVSGRESVSSAAQPAAPPPLERDAGALTPGVPVELPLAPDERHRHSVTLAAGDYLQARVDQYGIDVIVQVLGPDGKEIETWDQLTELDGPERVEVIAESAGPHRLVVHSEPLPGVKAGRYRLLVEGPRAATEGDRAARQERWWHRDQLAAATARLTEIVRKPDQLEYEKVWDTLERLLPFFRANGRRRDEAQALELQGTILMGRDDFAAAVAHSEARLPWLVGARYAAKRARALTELAEGLSRTGDMQRAIESFKEAASLPQTPLREAITLDNLGAAHRRVGEFQLALDAHRRALDAFGRLGARRSEGVVLTRIALVWGELGDAERAVSHESRALALYREVGDRTAQARSLLNLTLYELLRRNVEAARGHLTEASELAEASGNASVRAQALVVTAGLHVETKQFDEAAEAARRALPLLREQGDRQAECGALADLGRAERARGRGAEAVEAIEAALAIARRLGDPSEPSLLRRAAELARDAGDLDRALFRLEEALARIERMRGGVGGVQLRTKFAADKRGVHEDYIDVLQSLHARRPDGGFDRRAFDASELSRARSLLEVLAASYADVRAGVDPALLERERRLRRLLSDKDAAWRAVRDAKGEPAGEDLGREVADLAGELELVESEIRAKSPAFAELTQGRGLTLPEIQRSVLDADTVLLEYALGTPRSWLWAVTADGFVSAELDGRDSIERSAREVHERLASAGGSAADLGGALARLAGQLLGPVARRLRGDWAGKRLLVVAPGALEYVPFGVLPRPATGGDAGPSALDPLLAHHEVVNVPSASVVAAVRREAAGRPLAPRQLALLADPVFDAGDPRVQRTRRSAAGRAPATPTAAGADEDVARTQSARSVAAARAGRLARLPFSRKEAEAIAALVAPGDLLRAVDFAANREWATSLRLAEYRILHFATHGIINAAHPELSSLVLSLVDERGRPREGLLRMHDVYNQRLPVELVVLSACQTALGREFAGEGLVGLTRGFMYAGAKRVVASLWQVDDVATAELMRRFYRGMLVEGKPPGAALRSAQMSMMSETRWARPFFWAGFTIQGDWR